MSEDILKVENLSVRRKDKDRESDIIKNLSFGLKKNRCLGIVGESGSGKSMTCKAILGLLDKGFNLEGQVFFKGSDILGKDKSRINRIRGKEISMILQNPMTSFDPLYSVGDQMVDTFVENIGLDKKKAFEVCLETLEDMKIDCPLEVVGKYPHQLSGGMLQRIMIGITLALKPSIIIADEPTTAVDAVNVNRVMEEFVKIKKVQDISMIFISHDLGVIEMIADDIMVMKDGKIVEIGVTDDILKLSKNNYTRYLVDTRRSLVEKFRKTIGQGGYDAFRSRECI